MNLGRPVAPRFSSSICSGTDPLGICGIDFLWVRCPFCQQTNSAKALKKTRHALATTSGLAFLTTRLATEGTLVTYTSLPTLHHTHTLTHTTVLRPFFWDYTSEPVPEEIFFWTFMVQGRISEEDTLTIRVGATPSGLISNPPQSSPIFMPDALPAATIPLHPSLGWALNMLACIRSGVVSTLHQF